MSQQELVNELLSLPVERQRLVAEFIANLKAEPVRSANTVKPTEVAGLAFIGMWKDREDLADSNDWVRNLRRNEW